MSTDDYQTAADAPPRRGWWGRNWKWAAPVGCLTPVLLCGGCFFAVFAGVFGAMKESTPYQDSFAAVQGNAEVREALGAPIEAGLLVQGRLHLDGNSKLADLSYPVSGPNGSGTVYVAGEADANGPWIYQEMRIRIDGGPEIDLRPAGAVEEDGPPAEDEGDVLTEPELEPELELEEEPAAAGGS